MVINAHRPAPTAAATRPAMNPSGRFSAAATGRAGLDASTVRAGAGREKTLGGAGGRLNGVTNGCSPQKTLIEGDAASPPRLIPPPPTPPPARAFPPIPT